jgi:regulator of protease activity HflC (stomatin/prohibitin superfamily)
MPRYVGSYLFGLCAFVVLAAVFGLIGPKMLSSRSDELVYMAIAMVLAVPIILAMIYARWKKSKDGRFVRSRMKNLSAILVLCLVALSLGACSNVPAGHVGVVVNTYGSDKGVSEREVGVGKYWLGWNEQLFLFPTFMQTDTWQKTASKDESIVFQTGKDGMLMNADFGITFAIDPKKVAILFQTYRKGIDEISDIYLRNLVRDALNEFAAKYSADEVYGPKKNELMDQVEAELKKAVASRGIIVEKVYLIGGIRLPRQVQEAVDEKNKALQKTLQREQEIIQAKAEADIKIAEARGRAESVLMEAKAQAEANRLVAASITPELVRYRGIDKWDGALPRLNGGGVVPFIDVGGEPVPAKPVVRQ